MYYSPDILLAFCHIILTFRLQGKYKTAIIIIVIMIIYET